MSQDTNKKTQRMGLVAKVMLHAVMTIGLLLLLPLLILPLGALRDVLDAAWTTPTIAQASASHVLVLGVLAALMSATLIYMTTRSYNNMSAHKRVRSVVKVRRGAVMTETLITLPPFFLLCFGLSQLSVNSIAQILANVAVHRAAQSVWVWDPETSSGRAGSVNVADRACIGVAGVMAPVAPGDYSNLTTGNTDAMKKQRAALVLSQIPITGVLGGVGDAALSAAGVLSAIQTVTSGQTVNSMNRALDDSSFVVRSYKKFSAAYSACEVTVGSATASSGQGGKSVPGYKVNMKYFHYQAMPFVGRYFSGWWSLGILGAEVSLSGDAIHIQEKTGRLGHFITIKRELVWPKQAIKLNNRMPVNNGDGSEGGSGVSTGSVKGAL
jgi:hypothetical protein